MFINKSSCPDWLAEKTNEWGERWKQKKEENAAATFSWPTHDGKKINTKIVELFSASTANHCSYCDGFPMDVLTQKTLDHFWPKDDFPMLVTCWNNLFLCCNRCQKAKGSKHPNHVLKPDDPSYSFESSFQINFLNGEIEPNRTLSGKSLIFAKETISVLGLNDDGLPSDRLRQIKRLQNKSNSSLSEDEQPYRFIKI